MNRNISRGVSCNHFRLACRHRLGKGVIGLLWVLAYISFEVIGAYAGAAEDGMRQFTVKDLIEMSYIVDPAPPTAISTTVEEPVGVPISSPDKKYFLVVTQSGHVATNSLEGTIWLFDRQAVSDRVTGKSTAKLTPRKLVTMIASSNTPVVCDVRWIAGSKRIAFMGKNGSPYQRLFVLDVATGAFRPATKERLYVTAYDMRADTIVYTSLAYDEHAAPFDTNLIDADGKSILQLLYQAPPRPEGIGEDFLLLHVQKKGKDLPLEFSSEGRPLELFAPVLSLSPDSRSLITIAPVAVIPSYWEQYRTPFEDRHLKTGPTQTLRDRLSFWRPEQFVTVNLTTGKVAPVLDAPAGRDLGYADTPNKTFWLDDSRRVLIANTYLPVPPSLDAKERARRQHNSVISVVDLTTGEIGPSLNIKRSPFGATSYYEVSNIRWDVAMHALTLCYQGTAARTPEFYVLRPGEWAPRESNVGDSCSPREETQVTVRQDLNTPPELWGRIPANGREALLWNPNPHLDQMKIGRASIYKWKDSKSRPRAGILVLPPGYRPGHRYPLVIQTHGYGPDRFFADGWATTGNGGRALAAKDMIVFQMDESLADFSTPEEAPIETDAFESLIAELSKAGLVDETRVGVIGFSRTCFHVRYALTHRQHLFRAASITDGFDPSYVAYTLFNGTYYSVIPQIEKINGGPALRR
jgi:dipeptidyl aminopeptidase/acylaminoacyl peptidase